jgi:hypothetical protein
MQTFSFAAAALVGLLAVAPLAHAQGVTDQLKSLQGKSRPVVVLSDSRDDPRVARQISALDHTRPDLDQRNIEVLTEAHPGSKLRKSLGVAEHGFAVVLVGKDGSVKKVWRDPVDPHQIFTIIDSMPMRQQEMRG